MRLLSSANQGSHDSIPPNSCPSAIRSHVEAAQGAVDINRRARVLIPSSGRTSRTG